MKIKVALFCGGRGSKTIIHELLKRQNVELTLLVNAYDDGLSTGALRNLIPGMLGPSDFRKNSTYLLSLHSEDQYLLQELIEYRFAIKSDYILINNIVSYCLNNIEFNDEIFNILKRINPDMRHVLGGYVGNFCDFVGEKIKSIDFSDYSFGNIIFSGIYLSVGRDFNKAVDRLNGLMKAEAKICNVSDGEGLTLVALKKDGKMLLRESEVVGAQSDVPIHMTYLLDLDDINKLDEVRDSSFDIKRQFLENIEIQTSISKEAENAIVDADILIYGPGTQHSSLLPSYKIAKDAIRRSRANIKIFTANLDHDHDIQNLTAKDLVDNCLLYLNDSENLFASITHLLYSKDSILKLGFDRSNIDSYKSIKIIDDNFVSLINPAKHSGFCVVDKIFQIYNKFILGKSRIHILIDARANIMASQNLIDSILDLPLHNNFLSISMTMLVDREIQIKSGEASLAIVLDKNSNSAKFISKWFFERDEDYLLFLGGDGEYNVGQIFDILRVSENFQPALVMGSRTQSRKQFLNSILNSYRENTFAYHISRIGAYVISMAYMVRYGRFLIDPLSEFHFYSRSPIKNKLNNKSKLNNNFGIASIIKCGGDILEYPVFYKTNKGFMDHGRRLRKGFVALMGVLTK